MPAVTRLGATGAPVTRPATAETTFQPSDAVDETGEGSIGGLTQDSATGRRPTAALALAMTPVEVSPGAMR